MEYPDAHLVRATKPVGYGKSLVWTAVFLGFLQHQVEWKGGSEYRRRNPAWNHSVGQSRIPNVTPDAWSDSQPHPVKSLGYPRNTCSSVRGNQIH